MLCIISLFGTIITIAPSPPSPSAITAPAASTLHTKQAMLLNDRNHFQSSLPTSSERTLQYRACIFMKYITLVCITYLCVQWITNDNTVSLLWADIRWLASQNHLCIMVSSSNGHFRFGSIHSVFMRLWRSPPHGDTVGKLKGGWQMFWWSPVP